MPIAGLINSQSAARCHSVLFVALCRTSRQFVTLSNTVITPENRTPHPGTPPNTDLKVCVGRYLSITNFLLGLFLRAGVGIGCLAGVPQEQGVGVWIGDVIIDTRAFR